MEQSNIQYNNTTNVVIPVEIRNSYQNQTELNNNVITNNNNLNYNNINNNNFNNNNINNNMNNNNIKNNINNNVIPNKPENDIKTCKEKMPFLFLSNIVRLFLWLFK